MDKVSFDDETTHNIASGINLNELVAGEGVTFDVNFDALNMEDEELFYNSSEILDYNNSDCVGLVDEDTYDDAEPFEQLSLKMTNVIDDGKIKKRILREGHGLVVPDLSLVTIDYNAYVEYNDEPFDSTYMRKKPFTFRLSSGGALPGLDIAVGTMKPNEKSQFLVHPSYAYGIHGCLARVPANAAILFEIDLKNFSDSGASVSYPNLDSDKQKVFSEIYKFALALCSKGNDYFHRNSYKLAIKEYNTAVSKLEFCEVADYSEQEMQQKILLRLYINLMVSYNKMNNSRKACTFCNKIFHMTKGTSIKVPAKVYFNNARALMRLSDFGYAETRLLQARKLEPTNTDISKEFMKLEELKKIQLDREVHIAKAMFKFSTAQIEKEKNSKQVSDEFKKIIKDLCEELTKDNCSDKYKLPPKLTQGEKDFIRNEVQLHGLQYQESSKKDDENFLSKPSE